MKPAAAARSSCARSIVRGATGMSAPPSSTRSQRMSAVLSAHGSTRAVAMSGRPRMSWYPVCQPV